MIEILAPCGGVESLTAALNSGANAVYLGEENFSARKNADNFTNEQLADAVKACHNADVKVYLALNTLIFDKEMKQLSETVLFAGKIGIDGVIVQDLGVVSVIRQLLPEMPIHASTQMTINSLSGAIIAEKLGFSRIVLGRELSYEQIREITQNISIETEVFVHGALCVSVSGQCYMSSVLGGRSGNRGLCAQPCRLNFTVDDRQNVLSLKDLCLIDELKRLKEIGVTSFKIEGRMKRPEYIAGAVNACKIAIDGGIPDLEPLKNVFSRSGFTKGYFEDDFSNMQGVRTKEDVVAAPKSLAQMKQLYHKAVKRFVVDISAYIKTGNPMMLTAECNGIKVSVTGEIPQTAINREGTSESVCQQLAKLGGTLFEAGEITCEIDSGLAVSASMLNEIRRDVISQLSEKISEKNTPHYEIGEIKQITYDYKKPRMKYRCEVSTRKQLSQALLCDDFQYIYAPIDLLDAETEDKFRIIAVPKIFLADCEKQVEKQLLQLKKWGFERALAHTIGHVELIQNAGLIAHGGFRLNITNTAALDFYRQLEVEDCVLSIELLMSDAKAITPVIPTGIIAYGRLPLMLTRRCPIKNDKPCDVKANENCRRKITDRQGNEMPIMCSNAVEILNPDVLFLSDRQQDLNSFDFVVLRFTIENNVGEIYEMYENDIKPEGKLTRGLYYRGVQ